MSDTETNEAVARKLGWTIDHTGAYKPGDDPQAYDVPNYCHSIVAAWEICEQNDFWPSIQKADTRRWKVTVKGHSEYADTAPMAICWAFLKLEDK